MLFRSANRIADESAQLALMEEAARLLDDYHKQHREYPASLDSFAFTYPDGGDAAILSTLHYQSDGQTYSLTAKGISSGREWETGSSFGKRVVAR